MVDYLYKCEEVQHCYGSPHRHTPFIPQNEDTKKSTLALRTCQSNKKPQNNILQQELDLLKIQGRIGTQFRYRTLNLQLSP